MQQPNTRPSQAAPASSARRCAEGSSVGQCSKSRQEGKLRQLEKSKSSVFSAAGAKAKGRSQPGLPTGSEQRVETAGLKGTSADSKAGKKTAADAVEQRRVKQPKRVPCHQGRLVSQKSQRASERATNHAVQPRPLRLLLQITSTPPPSTAAFLAPTQALDPRCTVDALSHTRPPTDNTPCADCGRSPFAPRARFLIALLAGTGCDTIRQHDPISLSRQRQHRPSIPLPYPPESVRRSSARPRRLLRLRLPL